ncbi:hypothetical protein ACFYRC_02140 [Streptomyces sp. NPDC005279]|uniref:hypothetical protein n=1 Tax=Streptomyces sp. NPDC005279 TaxID=3364712 RepID=UPI003681A401
MTITQLPVPPAESAVDAWHAVVTAAHGHDLPAGVPVPGRVETEGKLRQSVRSSATCWGRSARCNRAYGRSRRPLPNGPMLAVNARLGYRRERPVAFFQAKL